MAHEFRDQPAHSSEHFGDTRDHWWNRDFLQLIARRCHLGAVRDLLDVGCGIGHWGMLLASVMPEHVRVFGIDPEPDWVTQATLRARDRGLADRFSYLQGDAQSIPFDDDVFDLTTCQTVLIHLPDPAAALAEMRRVTRPGGLILVAEPNNMTETLLLDSISSQASIHDIVELVRFQLTCERGKVALGEGDDSLGDRVPGLFAEQGLTDIQVYVNDKAYAVFPPYAAAEQQAFSEDMRDQVLRGLWHWNQADAHRLFLAGGGAEPDFAAHFARGIAFRQRIVAALDAGTYHGIDGGKFYLVAGRKPEKQAQENP